MHSQQLSPFTSLPKALVALLHHFFQVSDILNMGLVSKELYALLLSLEKKETRFMVPFNCDPGAESLVFARLFSRFCRSIACLNLSCYAVLDDRIYSFIFMHDYSNLKKLVLDGFQLTSENLEPLKEHAPHLESLVLKGPCISSQPPSQLSLYSSPMPPLSYSARNIDFSISALMSLMSLSLLDCCHPLTDSSIHSLARHPHLERISLQYIPHLNDAQVSILLTSTALLALNISSCTSRQLLGRFLCTHRIQSSLSELKLNGCTMLKDKYICQMATYLPSIQRLSVANTKLSADTLLYLVKTLELKHLNVSGCDSLSLEQQQQAIMDDGTVLTFGGGNYASTVTFYQTMNQRVVNLDERQLLDYRAAKMG